jgi:hypothetical protein
MSALDSVLDLTLRCAQASIEGFLALCSSTRKTFCEFRNGWRREEEENGVELRVVGFDEFDALGINVEDAATVLFRDGSYSGRGGAVPTKSYRQ